MYDPTIPPSPMAIFNKALDLDSPADRAAYFDRACGGDPALRARVEELLAVHARAGDFLESPAAPPPGAEGMREPAEGTGTVIGPYKLLEVIGEGGMGVVFMAEQAEPMRRRVALKVIKPGMDSRQVVARFEAERQALAMMEHPNIARVLDAGATESGRPYFVMELVRGIPITDYCDRERLSIPDRLDLFVQVCRAVQHAHQKGIIHRDIKPSNVLVTLHDSVPVTKVIDFGIAKATGQSLTDKTLFTAFAQMVGTPLYMSPEQAKLGGIDIDTRSDIYSLGVLLYELLTGTTPFDEETLRTAALDEVRRIIREQEPPRPSDRLSRLGDTRTEVSTRRRSAPISLGRSLRGELDWITMKALEKERARRYESASALAADIQRYRRHEPVEAGPPSAWYRLCKFARRNRAMLTTTAIVVATSAFYAARLDRAYREIERTNEELRRRVVQVRHHDYVDNIRHADRFVWSGQGRRALEILHRWRPGPGEVDVRNFAWHYLLRLCHDERRTLRGHMGEVYGVCFSSDGRTLASCGLDGTARIWDAGTGRLIRVIRVGGGDVNSTQFSADGRTLLTANDDGKIRLWDPATGTLRAAIAAHRDRATALLTADGRRSISAGYRDPRVKMWDFESGREIASISVPSIQGGAVSPDGSTLVTVGGDGFVRFWGLHDLDARRIARADAGPIQGVAYSGDGRRLVTGDASGRLVVWDLPRVNPDARFRGASHPTGLRCVAFLARDRMIVSGHANGILRLCDAITGEGLGAFMGHEGDVTGIAVSPDGTTFATASHDGTVKLWEARPPRREIIIDAPVTDRYRICDESIAFSRDGRTLVVATVTAKAPAPGTPGHPLAYYQEANLEVRGFDAETGAQRLHHVLASGVESYGPALTSDGATATSLSPDGWFTTWDAETGRQSARIAHSTKESMVHDRFLVMRRPGSLELVSLASVESRYALEGIASSQPLWIAPRRDLVALRDGYDLVFWDLATGRTRRKPHDGPLLTDVAALSPDGRFLASGDDRGTIRIWDVAGTDRLEPPLYGHLTRVDYLAFSPEGDILVSTSGDGSARLWDVATREELIAFKSPSGRVQGPVFSPDGRTVAYRAIAGDSTSKLCLFSIKLPEETSPEE